MAPLKIISYIESVNRPPARSGICFVHFPDVARVKTRQAQIFSMLFLHISDIHFRSPDCLDPFTDPEFPIRTHIMRDLAQQIVERGNVEGILVGGDIAFKAAADEYVTAWKWLQQLAEISGCPKERIFVVPGNHDVDRKVIENNVAVQNVHYAIASTELSNRESKLKQQLHDELCGQNLLLPHAGYNEFAAPLGCQIWPKKPFWHQDVPLGGGVNLRIYGLTSTLLSGQTGKNDNRGDLYVSPLQTVLDPAPNTANLVLLHHPVDWLEDGEEVDEALTKRAMFHLFGHKHKQRAILEANYVRLGAGAVNPSRSETPYDPGYNLIDIKVSGEGSDRRIDVELHQRRLQENPERFVAIQTLQREDVFRCSIALPVEAPIPTGGQPVRTPTPVAVDTIATVVEMQSDLAAGNDAEAAMGDEGTRDLLYRFWKLSSSQRRQIATRLNLLEEGELSLPEPERYGRALIRAGERAQIREVAAEVAKLEKR